MIRLDPGAHRPGIHGMTVYLKFYAIGCLEARSSLEGRFDGNLLVKGYLAAVCWRGDGDIDVDAWRQCRLGKIRKGNWPLKQQHSAYQPK